MTRNDLQATTRKKLAEMARGYKIAGWHDMRKSELVEALSALFRRRSVSQNSGHNRDAVRCRLRATDAGNGNRHTAQRDRLIAVVSSPHWLHVRWELSERILKRAEAALGVEWRQAVPVIRIYDVTEGNGTSGAKVFVKDVEIRQPLNDWYVPVERTGRSLHLQLGYRTPTGEFFLLAQSGKVKTPRAGRETPGEADYASEKGRRTLARRIAASTNGNGRHPHLNRENPPGDLDREFHRDRQPESVSDGNVVFELDAEVVIYGQAHPNAALTLMGRPVQQQQDGSFTLRMPLENGRQLIPGVCVTPDGSEQRTIVLAIERNTKHLEPQNLDELM